MADIHIDEFYHDCGKALSLLYNVFPRLTTLYVDDITSDSGVDEYGIPVRRHQACFDTLLWLAEEGYLRYQDRVHQNALDQAVLTEKSFLRLSQSGLLSEKDPATPDTLTEKRATLAWQLRKAVNNGSTSTINQSVRTFFGS